MSTELNVVSTSSDNTLLQVENFLRSKYEFKFNDVSQKTEYRSAGSNDEFNELTDFEQRSFLREIKLADLKCSEQTLRMLLASDFANRYNHYDAFMASLPRWDSKTDHIGKIVATIQADDQTFFEFCFRKWFVAMALSWIDSQTINHTALIISGAQGIGKTTWLQNLIPDGLKKYIFSGRVNFNDKDLLIKLSECPIIVMDELENMSVHTVDALKELITKSHIYVRKSYGFNHQHYVRRASICGSTNSTAILYDITGNRRFLCFVANAIDYRSKLPLLEAYAQAYALAKGGFQHWFDQNEQSLVDQHNEMFRVRTKEEELLTAYYETTDKSDPMVLFLTTTQILKNLMTFSSIRTLTDQRLGRVLNALGYVRTKRDGVYGYLIKPKQ